jgi:Mlc titration factor MtfA (ptsG expression regulator)
MVGVACAKRLARRKRLMTAALPEAWREILVRNLPPYVSIPEGLQAKLHGHNVVLHEFAHQLDQADGVADGTPVLDSLSCYSAWARCLTREYKSFLKRVSKHKPTVIDEYGATNSAEFFATATEAFFEKPEQLKRKRPDLYEELKHYYHMDPLEWEG